MAEHKISISFKQKYFEVYLYFKELKNNKENISDYLCKLVEADMNKEFSSEITLEQIKQMIIEVLKTNNPTIITPHLILHTQDILSIEDSALLNNLF